MSTRSTSRAVIVPLAAGMLAVATLALVAQAKYEPARTVPVTETIPAAFVQGPHFTLGPTVSTPGYFDEFALKSEYGDFEVEGQTLLAVRLREIEALARLDEVSKSEVFVEAAGTAVLNVGKSAVGAVTSPVETAKGVGSGIKRFGVNLGRKTKRSADKVVDGAGSNEEAAPSTNQKAAAAGESAANVVFGVNASMRRWAEKVGADPYTLNATLRQALEDVARIDAAGTIVTKVVVPIPTVVSTAGTVGDLVWKQDPEEIIKLNEKRAAEFGIDKKAATALYNTKPFTLTYQTAFVQALHSVKPKGAADYVRTATGCETEREAVFFTESALMMSQLHARSPVTALLSDSRALVAKTNDGRAVVLLPVDWVRWTAPLEKTAAEIARRSRAELGATRLELHVTGRVSPAAKQGLKALGWEVTEQVPVAIAMLRRAS